MYKEALKNHYIYKTCKGFITTEDLFDMSLTGKNGFNLDEVAKTIAAEIERDEKTSFVVPTVANPINSKKLEIVKDIIADKLAEQANRLAAKEKAEKRQKLLEILARKQDATLEAKSEAEILAELEALESE